MNMIDLNADLAEGFAFDEAILQIVSSANIACGVHAGSAYHSQQAVRWAKQYGVRIGAHPSYPDREHFGRQSMMLPETELRSHLLYQIGALEAICRYHEAEIAYIKPHGALYNDAANRADLAALLIDIVQQINPKWQLMVLSGSLLAEMAQQAGIGVIAEAFADRHYQANGTLVPRSQAGAVMEEDAQVITQVLQICSGSLNAITGETIALHADSICIHGDHEHALAFARQLQQTLHQHNIAIGNGLTH